MVASLSLLMGIALIKVGFVLLMMFLIFLALAWSIFLVFFITGIKAIMFGK